MYLHEYEKLLQRLIEDSPISDPGALKDMRDLVNAGEYGVAMDLLCTWIFEDDLLMSRQYYERLKSVLEELGKIEMAEDLQDLVVSSGQCNT